jgi:hypothetical protein
MAASAVISLAMPAFREYRARLADDDPGPVAEPIVPVPA